MRDDMFFAIVIILGLLGLMVMHEQVHVAIYRSYGIESHVEYLSHFPDAITIAEEGCPTETCMLANNLNEIVGYPLGVLYVVAGIYLMMRMD